MATAWLTPGVLILQSSVGLKLFNTSFDGNAAVCIMEDHAHTHPQLKIASYYVLDTHSPAHWLLTSGHYVNVNRVSIGKVSRRGGGEAMYCMCSATQ